MKPATKKFLVLSVYALLACATSAGVVPVEVEGFLRDHVLPAVLLAMGLGHVMPEAGKK